MSSSQPHRVPAPQRGRATPPALRKEVPTEGEVGPGALCDAMAAGAVGAGGGCCAAGAGQTRTAGAATGAAGPALTLTSNAPFHTSLKAVLQCPLLWSAPLFLHPCLAPSLSQEGSRTADNHRRSPPPPQTKVTIMGKNEFTIVKSDRAIFGTQTFWSQTPPPPSSLLNPTTLNKIRQKK